MKHDDQSHEHGKHYLKLLVMGILSFISMYVLMYAMVDRGENVVPNINQFYMAGLMTMPMIVMEVLLMKRMYLNKQYNAIIIGLAAVGLVGFYTAIRQQTAVSDKQFLKSMIPHHAGAVLMCDEANISDPEIKKLCNEIVAGQKKEITQMKAKLEELNGN